MYFRPVIKFYSNSFILIFFYFSTLCSFFNSHAVKKSMMMMIMRSNIYMVSRVSVSEHYVKHGSLSDAFGI